MSQASFSQIFKSTVITGGSSAVTLAVGLVKIKVLALIGGPFAVGLVGLLQNISSVAAATFGLGLASSSVRSIAAQSDDLAKIAALWRVLIWCNLGLGLLAGVVMVLGRGVIGELINQPFGLTESLIISIGIAATLIFNTQAALLQGLRRISALASINVLASIVGTTASLVPLYFGMPHAIMWFVTLGPLSSVMTAFFLLRAIKPLPARAHSAAAQLPAEFGVIFHLGLPIMAASLVTLGTQLIARSLIANNMNIESSGDFQAVMTITTTYIGFILSAMAADYYPRLSALAHKQSDASLLVNQQIEMALTIAAPVIVAMIVFSAEIITVLYSKDFHQSFELLRIQAIGDVLKILCWPMGYILLAKSRGGLFITAEILWGCAYLGLLVFFIKPFGFAVVGLAFVGAYVVLLVFLLLYGKRLINFRLSIGNSVLTISILLASAIVYRGAGLQHGLVLQLAILCLVAAYSAWRINRMTGIVAVIFTRFRKK